MHIKKQSGSIRIKPLLQRSDAYPDLSHISQTVRPRSIIALGLENK